MNSRRRVNSDVGGYLKRGLMFGMSWSFLNTAATLAIIFVLVFLISHFKLKRERASTFERDLWHLRLYTYFFVAVLLVAGLYLPHAFYGNVNPASEHALRDLILNQQEMAEDLRQFRQILFTVFLLAWAYLATVATVIGRLHSERQKQKLLNDSQLKKPLGLETD
ncbi:MAG TPA: hypothetical protein VIT88_05305 [Pyrinomonadaceae bacterium]